ncbi:MAG TPA: PP2C family protein-serine/threonine phosphatase, partial [Ignavibacteriaceae bacterium]|nr:PP2C family protein-serine/threonine phosphatase [Ignavibacteriaceae bacterium]
ILIKEIERTFGNDLHIGSGRIYERNEDEFILISDLSSNASVNIKSTLVINSNEVQSILNSKTYIFDNPLFSIGNVYKKEYAIPAAISIYNQRSSWILLFELKSGWIREEIEFCLNAIRSILNYRLLSESIKTEYEQAFVIQQSLLPTSSPQIPGYEIAGRSQQAQLVGGDIFDYYQFNDEEFGFCIGDASGHGIPAALMARDTIIGLRMGVENQMKMVHTLKKLNRVIYQSTFSTRFISLFYAEIEKDGSLFFVNAGHPSPILIYDDKITELESTGLVFGALKEIDLRRSHILLSPGCVLVLFTDGIVERQNLTGEELGKDLLKEIINKYKDKDAEEILNAIFDYAQKYGNEKTWKDDATVIVIKRTAAISIAALN